MCRYVLWNSCDLWPDCSYETLICEVCGKYVRAGEMQLVMCDEMSLQRRDIICCHQPFFCHIRHNLLPTHSFAHTNQSKSGFNVTLTWLCIWNKASLWWQTYIVIWSNIFKFKVAIWSAKQKITPNQLKSESKLEDIHILTRLPNIVFVWSHLTWPCSRLPSLMNNHHHHHNFGPPSLISNGSLSPEWSTPSP